MANYPLVKIGDVCRIEKGQTGIQSATPGDYPLVTTALERKSADTYQFDTAAVCIPLVSSTGHGKKTLNYVHFQEGKFALGTILAAVIPNDPAQLNAAYLHQYLQFYKDTKIVPWMKGAANVSLAIRDIGQIEVPIPPIEQQIKFIGIFNRATVFSKQLLQEFDRQSAYLTQLRQAILQEAIEGKLTAGWRAQNPVQSGDPATDATALLTQIQAEKARLIAEKKIKPEQPLPPIREEEMPFDLPVGWVWCRLGEITEFIDYRGKTPTKIDEGIRLITAKNVKKGFLSLAPEEFISEAEYHERMTRGFPSIDDIFFTTEAPLGNACLNTIDEPISVGQRIITIHPFILSSAYLLNTILSQPIQKEIDRRKTGVTAEGIKSKRLIEVPIPLPPLAEQHAIVERVDRLLALVDELAAQVAERKAQADALMQAVLREAFQPTPP